MPGDYLSPLEKLSDERPVIFYNQLGCGKSDRPKDPSLWRILILQIPLILKMNADLLFGIKDVDLF